MTKHKIDKMLDELENDLEKANEELNELLDGLDIDPEEIEEIEKDSIQYGQTLCHYNVAGTRILKYSIEVHHEGLNEHKLLSAPEIDILEKKIELQSYKWTEKWEKLCKKRRIEKQKEANISEANQRSDEAAEAIVQIDNLLIHTLSIDDTVDWDNLKKKDAFKELKPAKPTQKTHLQIPEKPHESSEEFVPLFSFFDKIFKSRKEQKTLEYENKYLDAVKEWENERNNIIKQNETLDNEYDAIFKIWENNIVEWKKGEKAFFLQQSEYNLKIDQLKSDYLNKNEKSIVEYCEMVLNNSQYPDSFPQNFELEYNAENKILVIEYELPSFECLPTIKEVKYIAAKKELKESFLSKAAVSKLFDESIYKIALRTIHELFEADAADALNAISLNGWITSINKATGKEETNCIVSIQVKKEEFINIDLSKVDPKTCFINLKGVASSKLNTLTPIQPILQISKTDKRFVEGYDVANTLDTTTNIAAMDWEDFEHLIREIFEKEFKVGGGEVKVTQASRDGGVDAIAFDPDPIRGGKIVIQAKRYTNTVGVSAVRDLYGTVVNEGATKGILVTTANYGSDAYEFANGKPLTLLNGSNLLHLLEKHGYHAKIDLREAKAFFAEKEK